MGRGGALIVLGLLGALACAPAPEREPAGEPPTFHDQLIYEGLLDGTLEPEVMPVVLPVDVRSEAILASQSDSRIRFPRDGSTEFDELDGVPVRVPGDDRFMVWHRSHSTTDRRIFAAHADRIEHSWPVLDYAREQAIDQPIVIGDRVVVVTEHAIAHAPILGGPPGLLALPQTPRWPLSSGAGRLVWIAQQSGRELVVSTDASFAAVEVEYDQPLLDGRLYAAAPVGDGIVFAGIDECEDAPHELVVRRKRADGSIIEVLRVPASYEQLRLLADGTQAWLLVANRLWWIGVDSHALVPEFDTKPSMIGADDGLLIWQSNDGLHVAGQPTVEFRQPFRWSQSDAAAELWAQLAVAEPDAREQTSSPIPVVQLKQQKVEGPLDSDMVRRIVRAHSNEIRSCYRSGLGRDSSLRGEIEIELVIDAGGRVARVEDRTGADGGQLAGRSPAEVDERPQSTGDDFADPQVVRCVARAARRWEFPKPRGGKTATVRALIALRPGE